ncbi:MAG: DUF4386 domain-containing protein [Candidatus Kariarchaeaceae archaeon]|jgi:hypothetical protein
MSFLSKYTPSQAALATGITLFLMLVISIIGLVEFFELMVFGDEAATLQNIDANLSVFNLGIISYAIVLILDLIVAATLYILFKPADVKLASYVMITRLLYTVVLAVAVISIAMLNTTLWDYAGLVGWVFFILHLFFWGLVVLRADYVNNFFGYFLILGSLSYLILEFGGFFLPDNLLELLTNIALIPAYLAEISTAIYVAIKYRSMPE